MGPGEHYYGAIAWAWANASAFAQSRIWYSVPVAVVAALIIGALTGGGSFFSRVRNGLIAAIASPVIVVAAVFLWNFTVLYPLDREEQILKRIEDLEKARANSNPALTSLDVHVAAAYWYRTQLNKLNELFARWEQTTQRELQNYIENIGPVRAGIDPASLEAQIKGIVQRDTGVELDFSRHPKFDQNRFYPAPQVEQITNDYNKEEYRRLYDQYETTKYTIYAVINMYEVLTAEQEDFIKKAVPTRKNCVYQKNGNFTCP